MVKSVIDHLNILLKNEITSITQYIIHAEILENQGFTALANKERSEIPDEINHARILTKRILFLEGTPKINNIGEIKVDHQVKSILESDFILEKNGIENLKQAIAVADSNEDYNTSNILQDILANEEEHYIWLKKQINLINDLGLELYLQRQIITDKD